MLKHAMIDDLKKYALIKKSIPYAISKVKNYELKIENRRDTDFDCLNTELLHWRKILQDSNEFIKDMDYCLSQLSPREEQSLRRFFIDRSKFYIEDLEIEWNVERTTVYNIKNRALDKLIFMWYGYQKDDLKKGVKRLKERKRNNKK